MERKWWTLIAVCVATFMLLIDVTIVNVALPDIQRDLGASLSSLQWVVNAYALTLASFLLVAGSVGDRLGRRRVFSSGFALFTIASLGCGLSGDPTLLNLMRAVQGAGAAAMFATSLALIAQEFEGRERANAIGIWGATVGGAVAVGPLIGGLLTESLGWEWIFFVNVPIGLGALWLTETKVVNVKATDAQPIDWPGVITFSASLFLLIFGLIRGNPEGWGSPLIVASLGGAVALMAAFIAIESRRENAMLDLSLFRKPAFTGVSAVAFALSAGMFAMFLYMTLYIQDVLGYSPLEAGLRVPSADAALVLRRAALGAILRPDPGAGDDGHRPLPRRHRVAADARDRDRRLVDAPASRLPARRDRDRDDQPGDRLDRDRRRRRGPRRDGLGINSTFRQIGIATGVAALGAIFQGRIESELSTSAPAGAGRVCRRRRLGSDRVGGRRGAGRSSTTRPRRRRTRRSSPASTRSSCSAPGSRSPAGSRAGCSSAAATSSGSRHPGRRRRGRAARAAPEPIAG